MTSESLVIIGLFAIAVIFLGVMVYMSQQQLIRERAKHKLDIKKLEKDVGEYIEKMKSMHAQELEQLKTLYANQRNHQIIPQLAAPAGPSLKEQKESDDLRKQMEADIKEMENRAKDIINEAELTAKSIVAEAQEKARLLLKKEEEQLHKSIVKVVIQVVKRVLNKSLTYEEHRQLILDSLKEIN